MKQKLGMIAASVLLVGAFGLPAGAQEDPNGACATIETQLASPTNGSTLGRVFTVRGQMIRHGEGGVYANAPVVIFIDDQFFDSTASGSDAGGPNFPLTSSDGSFNISIDLNNATVLADHQRLSDGAHKLEVSGYGDGCQSAPQVAVAFSLSSTVPQAPKVQVKTTQKPLPTPSESPSPSVAPVMATATPAVAAADNKLDPTVALILGALLGAALLSLAEVSALEYRKKHGAKSLKK